ncbi:MAG TPA: NADP-dependent oxidoreductase [Puia sp.]|nr:NADP-dependent oxidoreductase [Puia sp.]
MKAIILKQFGGVENLSMMEMPIPEVMKDEVLVKIKSISINPVDVKTRAGRGVSAILKNDNPMILGWDLSGRIERTGHAVKNFKTGDEVFAMVRFPQSGKVYAEYASVPASQLVIKPANITHEEAAAACLAALTSWEALTIHYKLNPGERVLIHAASGGVGHFAVQMAKYIGAYVIGTSSAANKDFVLSLGADEHVDYKVKPFESVVRNVDFVLDSIGGEYVDRSLKTMRKGATIVSIVSGLNESVKEKAEALGMQGFTMRVKPDAVNMQEIADLLERKLLASRLQKIFPFDQMADAHLQIESGRTVGKISLSV